MKFDYLTNNKKNYLKVKFNMLNCRQYFNGKNELLFINIK